MADDTDAIEREDATTGGPSSESNVDAGKGTLGKKLGVMVVSVLAVTVIAKVLRRRRGVDED